MQVRVINDTFINGGFPQPKKNEVREIDPDLARHLVECGVVEYVKVEAPVRTKKSGPASQPAPASQKQTAKRRGKKQTT